MTRRSIPAVYMRGGATKGIFFHGRDLPRDHDQRDALLLRIAGSPDPHGLHVDGMGEATAGVCKVAVITPSRRGDCDVECLFGAAAIGQPVIDWSRHCDDLCAAVGPFAICEALVAATEGITRVRIWQTNIGRRIDAFVPVRDGDVVEDGPFREDGVPFRAAEVRLEHLEPAGSDGSPALLPTGAPQDILEVADAGGIAATMISVGVPMVFVRAEALGLTGRETPRTIERDRKLLERLEAIRAAAAVRMGLADTLADASRAGGAMPGISWVARPGGYRTDGGAEPGTERIDLLARMLSMGKLHHGYTGDGSIALAAAAAVPGTVVAEVARTLPGVPTRIGHVSGTLTVGADVCWKDGRWQIEKAVLSRSARRLMSGSVHVPWAGPFAGA